METYRKLTGKEVDALKRNGCYSENWDGITVRDGFDTRYVKNTRFSGSVKLGLFVKSFFLEGGLQKHSGIYRAILHNCTLGDNVLVENVSGHISNYTIGENVYIENINTLAVTGETCFGNGTKVAVLDETGGREIRIFDKLSSHLAYIYANYRYKPLLISKLDKIIESYADNLKSDTGIIGKNSTIKNCQSLINICTGCNTVIDGASSLENGTIDSNAESPAYIGKQVTAKDFIIGSGSSVYNGTTLHRCFVGQACKIGNGFFATDSLFFSNCHMENGEACSIFGGPYTVSHHKSTLLIAAMFSFYNAGSGTNQSNHMYKLGPIHHGIMERGCKTASSSYIMWPGHTGAYSVVLGKHSVHLNIPELPFSYIIEKNGHSYIIPAINLRTAGTARDISKWKKRDERIGPHKQDLLNFTYLNPYITGKIIEGIKILEKLYKEQDDAEVYRYKNCLIRKTALVKGIALYKMAVEKYIGDKLIEIIKNNRNFTEGTISISECWTDLSGLILPKNELKTIIHQIEKGDLPDVGTIEKAFEKVNGSFGIYEWNWIYGLLKNFYKLNEDNRTEVYKLILEDWKKSSVKLYEMVIEDAMKEFNDVLTTGFGTDGSPEDKITEIEAVRGKPNDNPLIKEIRKNIRECEKIYNEISELLQ